MKELISAYWPILENNYPQDLDEKIYSYTIFPETKNLEKKLGVILTKIIRYAKDYNPSEDEKSIIYMLDINKFIKVDKEPLFKIYLTPGINKKLIKELEKISGSQLEKI